MPGDNAYLRVLFNITANEHHYCCHQCTPSVIYN
nr:MAG TPA: hypothetical protein [Caudoviricetes sp.]